MTYGDMATCSSCGTRDRERDEKLREGGAWAGYGTAQGLGEGSEDTARVTHLGTVVNNDHVKPFRKNRVKTAVGVAFYTVELDPVDSAAF